MAAGDSRFVEIAPPLDVWEVARDVLTPKQLQVIELRERHGASIYQIGYMLDLSPSTVRGHIAAASRKIRRALEQSAEVTKSGTAVTSA